MSLAWRAIAPGKAKEKDMDMPIGASDRDTVYLKLDKAGVAALPPDTGQEMGMVNGTWAPPPWYGRNARAARSVAVA
jgi:hypothetical protein